MTTVPQATYCMTPAQLALAQTLVKKRIELDLDQDSNRTFLCLPIKKIGHVTFDDEDIKIKIEKNADAIMLEIRHDWLPSVLGFQMFKFTKKNAKEDVLVLLDFIKNMTFNKEISQYVDKRKNEYTSPLTPTLWNELLDDCYEDVQTKWEECCVCKEITNTQLCECKHTICLPCCSRLRPGCEDTEDYHFKCPLCRTEISTLTDGMGYEARVLEYK